MKTPSYSRKMNYHISYTKARNDKKHNTFHVLLSSVLTNSSAESLRIEAWSRLRGMAEEVGFEPTEAIHLTRFPVVLTRPL
jgi:hypothetical protein